MTPNNSFHIFAIFHTEYLAIAAYFLKAKFSFFSKLHRKNQKNYGKYNIKNIIKYKNIRNGEKINF